MTESTSRKPSRQIVFFKRMGSTLGLWSLILIGLFAAGKPVADLVFLSISLVLCILGVLEFLKIAKIQGIETSRVMAIPGTIALITLPMVGDWVSEESGLRSILQVLDHSSLMALCSILVLSHTVLSEQIGPGKRFTAAGVTLLALIYVPYLYGFIQRIYILAGPAGAYYLVFFIIITKFSDVGAYITGSLIGRHKMIPRLSPGKTWEGFFGAIVIATGIGLLFVHFLGSHMPGLTFLHVGVLGILLSMSAVLGDLVESLFKREAGIKDSGNFLPGIGGILDLLDSLLFNAPLMYLYLKTFVLISD